MKDKSEVLGELDNIIKEYRYKHNLGNYEIIDVVLGERARSKKFVPVGVLRNRNIGVLEAVVGYLKEVCKLRFSEISGMLNRKHSTVATAYKKCKLKSNKPFQDSGSELLIPVEIFKNRKLSMLENAVFYLKDRYGMKNHDAAKMINRDDRTIWTVCSRIRKKGFLQLR